MRIVNFIQRYPPALGGAETWCREVSRHLARQGHEVTVLTMNVNNEEDYWREPPERDRILDLGPLAIDDGVIVRRYRRSLPIYWLHYVLYEKILDHSFNVYFYGPHSAEMYGRSWRHVREADIVFLHAQPHPHNFVGFALAKLLRKKVVIVPHFHPGHVHYERASNYWLLKNCHGVVAVSDFERAYLADRGIPSDRIYVTGNGVQPEEYAPVDLDRFRSRIETQYGLTSTDYVVTFLGRKTQEKGIGCLIDAAKDLLGELPLRVFLIGPRFRWFEELYAALSNEEKRRIIDLGVVSHREKVNLLHLSHLLALPSGFEAFGIAFLEAWVCDVPVIGTTEGAMPDLIGEAGLLCRFGDKESLKARIREAFTDPDRLRRQAERGKAKVLCQYTWSAIGAKAEEAVQSTYERR